LLVSNILGKFREVPIVSWGLVQHAVDKSLKVVNIHASRSPSSSCFHQQFIVSIGLFTCDF